MLVTDGFSRTCRAAGAGESCSVSVREKMKALHSTRNQLAISEKIGACLWMGFHSCWIENLSGGGSCVELFWSWPVPFFHSHCRNQLWSASTFRKWGLCSWGLLCWQYHYLSVQQWLLFVGRLRDVLQGQWELEQHFTILPWWDMPSIWLHGLAILHFCALGFGWDFTLKSWKLARISEITPQNTHIPEILCSALCQNRTPVWHLSLSVPL